MLGASVVWRGESLEGLPEVAAFAFVVHDELPPQRGGVNSR